MGLKALAAVALSAVLSQITVAVGAAVSLTTATPKTVTSLSLNAGTYLVWGSVDFALSGITSTEFRVGFSLATNTLLTQSGGGGVGSDPLSTLPMLLTLISGPLTVSCGLTVITLAAPATVFMVAQGAFTLGSLTAFGTLNALQINIP